MQLPTYFSSVKIPEKELKELLASEESKRHLTLCYNLAFVPTKEVENAYENHGVPSLLSVAVWQLMNT